MDILERLQPICSTDPRRNKLHSPFAVEWSGRKWAGATNGHCLALLPYDGTLRTDGPDATKVIPPSIAPRETLSVEALLAFAGNEVRRECDNCSGGGKCSWCECGTDHACGECNGTGTQRVLRFGILLDGGLDRDYLRRVLLTAPDGTTTVGVSRAEERGPFAFVAPGWLGLIMPITPGTRELKTAPKFSDTIARAG